MSVALVSTRAESGKVGGQNPNNGLQVRTPHAKTRGTLHRTSDVYRIAEHEDGNMSNMLLASIMLPERLPNPEALFSKHTSCIFDLE
jgi:hypothetical protein